VEVNRGRLRRQTNAAYEYTIGCRNDIIEKNQDTYLARSHKGENTSHGFQYAINL